MTSPDTYSSRDGAAARPPRVLIPVCNRTLGHHPFHVVGHKYVQAVRLAGCLPVVVPNVDGEELADWLDFADGVFLSGSPSNVHPSHYGEGVHDASLPLDGLRDHSTLPLIRAAVARGLPLMAVCRGLQEVNVALGGTLHQAVQEQPGLDDHRSPSDEFPVEVQYGLAHEVEVSAGGLLEKLLPGQRRFEVNSLHGQGVARLAPGLRQEARAPDGLVEAFSIAQPPGFGLCVQWHPEWQAAGNPVSTALFTAFGAACRAWRDARSTDPG
ncbi:MAG: gamma-glutamyl-gamma-aminobutyrate hydrolase family protein [Comamonas sp.]